MSAATLASRRRRSSPLLLLFGLTVSVAAAVPAGAQPAPEDKAVTEYRVTEGALFKVIQATADLATLLKSDPALTKRMVDDRRALYEKSGEQTTLAEIVAGYDRYLPVRRVMAKAGLTSREYVTLTMALALTELALITSELGERDPSLAPAVKANLAFRKRHEADLGRLEAQMKAVDREERKQRQASPPRSR